MQASLDTVAYGNRDIAGGLTRFGPGSSLKISPDERMALLRRFYRNQRAEWRGLTRGSRRGSEPRPP